MAIVTTHARRRTRKRLGIPKKSADANAERALRRGLARKETKSSLRRYLDAIYHQSSGCANIRVYHRSVYIFDDNVLITVFPLPRKYHEVADTLERRKNEKPPLEGGLE